METRKEAIRLGKTHYFTGHPCIHGHLSKRYVSTQNCVECQHPTYDNLERKTARLRRENAKAAAILVKSIRVEACSQMKVIKLKIRMEEINKLFAMVLAFAHAHQPLLVLSDVQTRIKPRYAGHNTSVYGVRCFPGDEAELVAFAATICPEEIPLEIAAPEPATRKDLHYPEGDPH